MIEIIAGIGIGLWSALAVTAVAALYAKKHDLLGDRRDRFLRGDIDSAFERIEDLEEEAKGLERILTDLTGKLTELYAERETGIMEPAQVIPGYSDEDIQKLIKGLQGARGSAKE